MEKLQELTEKIYREGVEKGRAEAARLVEEAKAEAARIVAEAETKAAETEAAGRKAAEELDKNTRNELKLYTAPRKPPRPWPATRTSWGSLPWRWPRSG